MKTTNLTHEELAGYTRHPLSKIFGDIPDEEFAKLVEDVRKYGVREPIVVTGNRQIIDGWNRARAAIECGVGAPAVSWDDHPSSDGTMHSLRDFVVSVNIHRRHLTVSQRVAMVTDAHDWMPGGRPKNRTNLPAFPATDDDDTTSEPAKPEVPDPKTNEELAGISGGSTTQVKKYKKVTKEDPELAAKVKSGEKSVHAAHEEIRERSKEPEPDPEPEPENTEEDNRLVAKLGKLLESFLESVTELGVGEYTVRGAGKDTEESVTGLVKRVQVYCAGLVGGSNVVEALKARNAELAATVTAKMQEATEANELARLEKSKQAEKHSGSTNELFANYREEIKSLKGSVDMWQTKHGDAMREVAMLKKKVARMQKEQGG